MKKITFLSFILVFMISSSVQASEWAYSFVVWDGKVYKVKEEELIEKSEIGKRIGKVKTQPYSDNRSSAMIYYGNASNVYPIGTPYYEIKGISPSTAIAVKVDNSWIKAGYVYPAPYHVMNTITNPFIILTVVIIGLILFEFFFRLKRLIRQRNQFN
jgi:hypothetical protein